MYVIVVIIIVVEAILDGWFSFFLFSSFYCFWFSFWLIWLDASPHFWIHATIHLVTYFFNVLQLAPFDPTKKKKKKKVLIQYASDEVGKLEEKT